MKKMRVQFLGQGDPLEEEMATHSSILAWEIPWAEEPGRLQFMGLQRVRLDLATKQQLIHSSTVQKSGKPENNPIINWWEKEQINKLWDSHIQPSKWMNHSYTQHRWILIQRGTEFFKKNSIMYSMPFKIVNKKKQINCLGIHACNKTKEIREG